MSGAAPEIDAGRCVHALAADASCRACVSACPRQAWVLDDEGLNLSLTDCDGCGLCVAVCPTRALRHEVAHPVRRGVGGQDALMAACERAVTAPGEGVMPCLHALGVTELLRHWEAGDRIWLVSMDDCDTCARGQGERLGGRVERINALLHARGRSQLLLKMMSADAWQRVREMGGNDLNRENRRAFFSRLVKRPVPVLAGHASEPRAAEVRAPGEYLAGHGPLPWTIRIDPMTCVGCHACVEICPSAALQREGEMLSPDSRAAPCYRLHHAQCTGCGLCLDVCAFRAIRIQAWERPEQDILLLHESLCPSCGVVFQFPAVRMEAARTCWVCAHGHARPKLFQVLEADPPAPTELRPDA